MWRLRLIWAVRRLVVRRAVRFSRVLAVRLVASLSVVWFGALMVFDAAWAEGSPRGLRAVEDYTNGRGSLLDLLVELVSAAGTGARSGAREPAGVLLLVLGIAGVFVGMRSVVGSIKVEIMAWEYLETEPQTPSTGPRDAGEDHEHFNAPDQSRVKGLATLRARRIRLLYGTTTALAAAPIAASVPALCFATLLVTGHLDLAAWEAPPIRVASALTVFTGLGTTRILGMLQLRRALGPVPFRTCARL